MSAAGRVGLADVPGRLLDRAEDLGVALAAWAYRDEARDKAAARRAATTAAGAIDAMLAELHAARAVLVAEVRQADDAAIAHADELLATCRGGGR